jgi:outer membrane biogenesis lipoprotein LolB
VNMIQRVFLLYGLIVIILLAGCAKTTKLDSNTSLTNVEQPKEQSIETSNNGAVTNITTNSVNKASVPIYLTLLEDTDQ